MLKISGPSRITQETADFSKKKQGCIYYKHVRRSDLISERSVIFMRKKLIQITISNLTGNIQLGEQLNAFFGVAT